MAAATKAAATKAKAKAKAKAKVAAKPRARREPPKALHARVAKIEQALTSGLGLNLAESDAAAVQVAAEEPTPEAEPLTYEERLCRIEIVLRRQGFYL